jgi:hypothetical protein
MSLLNYTTQISTEKTVTEIQRILAAARASAILTEYDTDGVLSALSFRVTTPFGLMSFRLPANVDKIFAVIQRDKSITPKLRTREQAARVAWRIQKDWLEAQLAIVKAEMVTLEQVFLPYAQNGAGVTVYEALRDGHFNGLALPAPR